MWIYSTETHYDYEEPDYNEIGPFNDTSRHYCFSINIIDDLAHENAENFMVRLDLNPGTTRVSVDPHIIRITIIDNDSELSNQQQVQHTPQINFVNSDQLHPKWWCNHIRAGILHCSLLLSELDKLLSNSY